MSAHDLTSQLEETTPMYNPDATIRFPLLDLSSEALDALFLADEPTRFEVVKRLYEAYELSFDEVPEAWTQSPLRAWCWLVLRVNDLDPSAEHRPLTSWGIDTTFAPREVQAFVWAIA